MVLIKNIMTFLIPAGILMALYYLLRGQKIAKVDYSGAQISDEKAEIIVQQLHQAMSDFGTDEEMIYTVLKPLTIQDFKKVYNFWGLKPYLWFGTAPEWLAIPYDLVFWLKKELGTSNKALKNKIESAGFSFD